MDYLRARDRIDDDLRHLERLIGLIDLELLRGDHGARHPSDRGGQEHERIRAVRASLERERTELRAALRRIDAGTYGAS